MIDHSACAEAAARVYPFLDGELTWIRRVKVRWHLRACTRCQAAFVFETYLKGKVSEGLVEECPDDVIERLRGFLADNR